jgi:hypothetical protein
MWGSAAMLCHPKNHMCSYSCNLPEGPAVAKSMRNTCTRCLSARRTAWGMCSGMKYCRAQIAERGAA